MENYKPSIEEIENLYERLLKDAKDGGYFLNPDVDFTKALIEGLIINEKRYEYEACPCRLAYEKKELDLDIICPCDYRDQDLAEYNACYCGLYVSEKIVKGEAKLKSLPDRRPAEPIQKQKSDSNNSQSASQSGLSYPVWRCKVCGYLCARENPPEKCPVCKVSKERFESFGVLSGSN